MPELQHRFNARVLLVEDVLANQKVATAMLTNLGLQVDTAQNGREAVEYCSGRHYDLVFMDCNKREIFRVLGDHQFLMPPVWQLGPERDVDGAENESTGLIGIHMREAADSGCGKWLEHDGSISYRIEKRQFYRRLRHDGPFLTIFFFR